MSADLTPEVLVDMSCDCDRCVARTTEMYDLPGHCLNCGARFTVRSRKGDKPPFHVECPECECWEWSWRRPRLEPLGQEGE